MPFKKKRASGNTVPPRKREKKSTLLVRQQREAKNNDAADLGGTAGVNPTGGAAESTGRPSPRSIPQVNYAEESSDDEKEIDPETYKEPPLPSLKFALKSCTVLRMEPLTLVMATTAEIIADSIEGRNSIRMTRLIVNQYRRKFQLPALTYWSQGSKNKTDAWCRASFRWFAQLLLRFGEIDFSHPIFQKLLGPAYVKEKPPPCYDTSLLTPLKLSQVVWFDELHKQCHIGESGSRVGPGTPNVAISFKRNANGKLDPNGKYPEKGKTVLQVKYERQARFNFGVYMSKDGKGHRVQPPFEYTGKKLITRVERNKLRLQAIGYCIPKLKSKTFEKLQQHNLCLVHDVKALSGNTSEIRTIAASVSGISFERLSAFVCAAEACLEGSPPPMCVTEMIDFMFDQTKATLGENGFVYHDALILMTSADSVLYMKEKGYYKSWILPELDLMEECGGVGGGALKAYRNRPVGNRPEANPLDTSLFRFHQRTQKFSLATPDAISSAYNRIWTLHPKSETIVKDIKKVLRSFLQVVEAEGVAIDGVGDRSGRRYIPKDQHGGKRVRKLKDDFYDEERVELHKDAEDAVKCIVEKAEAKFKISNVENN
eukprot:jgi/Psemu1/33007/gm1.33007_g